MKILLLAATQMEIMPFLESVRHTDVIITGVGMAATAYHLAKQLSHHHYDLVIQAGVAGAFANTAANLQLGQVVLVRQDAFGDLGAYENGRFSTLQDMGLGRGPEWLHNPHWILNKLDYKKVNAITVNTITNDAALLAAICKRWAADVESMEGAALHYACLQKQVPFLQVRSISNYVGERNKANWRLADAVTTLNQALASIVAQVGVALKEKVV